MSEVDYSCEIWKRVVGMETTYSISNYGRLRREVTKSNSKAGYILTPFKRKNKYCCYTLWSCGKQHVLLVHRLVAKAFLPTDPNRPHVNHKDGNPANNHVSNLEWCTPKENVRHAIDVLGRRPGSGNHPKGESHYKAKVTKEQVDEMRRLHAEYGWGGRKLGKMFGLSKGGAGAIISGKSWK